jgi:hypothetical protein
LRAIFKLLLGTLVTSIVAGPFLSAAAGERLPDFSARYTIRKAGLNVIRTTFTLKRGPGTIEYRSAAEPIGIASWFFGDHRIYELSLLKRVDEKVIPLEYRYIHKGSDENRNEHYVYDWDTQRAQVNYRGEQKTLKIPVGTLDNFSLQLALIQDAGEGREKMTYPVISKGELKTYTFINLGTETVETRLGDFEAIGLERRKDDENNTTYTTWYAPELHYLPVKLENREQGDVVLNLTLEEVEWR